MPLPYTTETISSPDNIVCKVLDTKAVNFSAASEGRKATETLVRRAEGGEPIVTKNKEGKVESVYTAQAGDAIFINLHNPDDGYVPGNADGSRWQFKDLTSKGYEITGDDQERGGVLVKSTTMSKLLHEIVEEPTCVKNAWGEGQHQFLFAGATLKLNNNGSVTGIDKAAFDATWEITSNPIPRTADIQTVPKLQNG
jgi:hypothetical protein